MKEPNKNEPLRFAHTPMPQTRPRYVRKNGKGYEYGEIDINWDDRTKDKHCPLGKADTLDEALAANSMAALPKPGPFDPLTPRRPQ